MTVSAINNMNGQVSAGSDKAELRRYASEVVNQVFYGTLLRQFREAQKPVLFGKGPGGSTFTRQLDMELIKRISQRGDTPLVDAIMKQLANNNGSERNLAEAGKNNKVNFSEIYSMRKMNV